jgi:hypothetical protein
MDKDFTKALYFVKKEFKRNIKVEKLRNPGFNLDSGVYYYGFFNQFNKYLCVIAAIIVFIMIIGIT